MYNKNIQDKIVRMSAEKEDIVYKTREAKAWFEDINDDSPYYVDVIALIKQLNDVNDLIDKEIYNLQAQLYANVITPAGEIKSKPNLPEV